MVKKIFYVLIVIILNFIFINISCYAGVHKDSFVLYYNNKVKYEPNKKDCKLSAVTTGIFNSLAEKIHSSEDYNITANCINEPNNIVLMSKDGANINCDYGGGLYFRFYKKLNNEVQSDFNVWYQGSVTEDCLDTDPQLKKSEKTAKKNKNKKVDATIMTMRNSMISPTSEGLFGTSAFNLIGNIEDADKEIKEVFFKDEDSNLGDLQQKQLPILQQAMRADQVLLKKQLECKQNQYKLLQERKLELAKAKDQLMHQVVNTLGNAHKVSVYLKDLELGKNKIQAICAQLSQQQITDLSATVTTLRAALTTQGERKKEMAQNNDALALQIEKLKQELNQKNTDFNELEKQCQQLTKKDIAQEELQQEQIQVQQLEKENKQIQKVNAELIEIIEDAISIIESEGSSVDAKSTTLKQLVILGENDTNLNQNKEVQTIDYEKKQEDDTNLNQNKEVQTIDYEKKQEDEQSNQEVNSNGKIIREKSLIRLIKKEIEEEGGVDENESKKNDAKLTLEQLFEELTNIINAAE